MKTIDRVLILACLAIVSSLSVFSFYQLILNLRPWFAVQKTNYPSFVTITNNLNLSRFPFSKSEWNLEKEEPFYSRKAHVIKLCKSVNTSKFNLLSERIKYSDSSKLIMCETPKVASSTWQVLLLRLSGYKKRISHVDMKRWAFRSFPTSSFNKKKMKLKEAQNRVAKYTSFLISRHPLARLVSAYYDKFSKFSKYPLFKREYGRRMAFQLANQDLCRMKIEKIIDKKISMPAAAIQLGNVIKSLSFKNLSFAERRNLVRYKNELKTGELSFSHFVDYIIYEKEHNIDPNPHWNLQVNLCMPCLVNYTLYAKFENLTAESERLLQYFQRYKTPNEHHFHFPQKMSAYNITDQLVRKVWRLVPEEKVEKIRKIYKGDFKFYDYDPYLYLGHNITSEA